MVHFLLFNPVSDHAVDERHERIDGVTFPNHGEGMGRRRRVPVGGETFDRLEETLAVPSGASDQELRLRRRY